MKPRQSLPFTIDYPAAHSMDTTWFAVDKDGHVAAFESSEGGAVPNDAMNDQQGEIDPLAEILPHATPCDVIYALDDRQSPLSQSIQHVQPQKPYRRSSPSVGLLQRFLAVFKGTPQVVSDITSAQNPVEEELVAPVIMMLPDVQVVASALAEGVCRKIKCLRGNAVLFTKLPIELYRSIHNRQQCVGCHYMYGLEPDEAYAPPQYSKSGLFHYVCCEDQMAVPYGRHTIPERPLNIDQLPAELRDQFAKLQFADLSFSQTPYIQPVERVPCFTWDGSYLREDWKTLQANFGQEEEYKEFYQNIAGIELPYEFNIQPPGG